MQNIHQHVGATTPQNQPIPNREAEQVLMESGGYGFTLDGWARLNRFLIIGTEGGGYYLGERDLTVQNTNTIRALITTDGPRVVAEVVRVRAHNLAPKNDPALFVLALCSAFGDDATKSAAHSALQGVCGTFTHLATFLEYAKAFRGIGGSGLTRGVANIFQNWTLHRLALQSVKYRNREGWTPRDFLRVAHPSTDEIHRKALFNWIVTGEDGLGVDDVIDGYLQVQTADSAKAVAQIVERYRLPWEAVPNTFAQTAEVQMELLRHMPMTATIRQLGRLSSVGILEQGSEGQKIVTDRLQEVGQSRVHPAQVLIAMAVYAQGRGVRSEWKTNAKILDALDAAYYASYKNVEPTGKRILCGLDASGSMGGGRTRRAYSSYRLPGNQRVPLTPCQIGAAMCLVTLATEENAESVGFTTRIYNSTLSPRQRLDDAVDGWHARGEGTDCARPILWALREKRDFDAFVLYTDGQSWAGDTHVAKAMEQYRAKRVKDARLVVVYTEAYGERIHDPVDPGSLECAGFDASVPSVISSFVGGKM